MKIKLKPVVYVLLLCVIFTSCNKDDLAAANAETEQSIENAVSLNELTNAVPGETIVVSSEVNLEGQTISLPSNVKLQHNEGGSIINGTLDIAEDTEISGELLTPTLRLTGVKARIFGKYFFFNPDNWGIVQGEVSDAVALQNKLNFQQAIDDAENAGVKIMFIGKMDAYFAVAGNHSLDSDTMKDAIRLPSDFNLKMASNTYLRVQPNNMPRGILLAVYKEQNVSISGGNLIGDRYEHTYTPIKDEFGISRNSHEWPALLSIAGSSDVTVYGMNLENSTGDGLVFASGTNRLYTPAIYCQNILVKSCTVKNSRRNNMTLGDGEYITIENCTITGSGGGTPIYDTSGKRIYDSSGVAPQLGIDLEAHRELQADGTYLDYQKVEHVIIRWNTFRNNNTGDVVVYTANDVLIENNDCNGIISGMLCYNITIRNNVLNREGDDSKNSCAIRLFPIVKSDGHKSYNNAIIGNKISGYNTGLSVGGKDIEVKENIVRDFKEAFYVNQNLENGLISNNDFQSDRTISYGYMAYGGQATNVVVKNDKVVVKHRPILLWGFNRKSSDNHITFDSCDFNSTRELYFERTNNVTLTNNNLLGSKIIKQTNCENIVLQNNK